jgi:RNA polymerase sigma factor (sigma-70 family)
MDPEVTDQNWLAQRFEQNRGHLRAVAYRMLGSLSEADDALQETWLRLGHTDTNKIDNLGGWLTTVVARVCLDMLRSRTSRREDPLDAEITEPAAKSTATPDPEQEAVLADSVGLALLVVLDRLSPAERLAFVLHDLFAVPFDEIAPIIGRTEAATRQLASRARRRVQGERQVPNADLHQQRDVVERFLAALRAGDVEGLVAVLDPDVLVRVDAAAAAPGPARQVRGAETWAKSAIAFSRGARFVRPVLVDGTVGAVLAPQGHLSRVLRFTLKHGKIAQVDIIADPARLQELDLAVLEG